MKRIVLLLAGLLVAAFARSGTSCDWCDVTYLKPKKAAATRTGGGTDLFWTRGEGDTNRIDILIAFDRSATNWLTKAGYASPRAFAKEAVRQMNEGLANTELDRFFLFRLAGITIVPSSLSSLEAWRVANKAAGFLTIFSYEKKSFDRILSAREKTHADVVAILYRRKGENGSSIGLRGDYWTAEGLDEFKESAYCACDIKSALEDYTLLHEVGHLMGAGHSDVEETFWSGPQLFDYSAGYHFTAGGVRYTTVMGYTTLTTGEKYTRLPFFSSPDYTLLLEDEKTGELYDSKVAIGTKSANDNTRTLRETYPLVANFRVANMLDVWPTDPHGVTLAASGWSGDIAEGGTIRLYRSVKSTVTLKVGSVSTAKTTVSGLPAGLAYDSSTGKISGRPTRTGTSTVMVVSTNKKGRSATLTFKIKVSSLPSWAYGSYSGSVEIAGETVPVSVKVASSGKMSGTVKFAGGKRTFSATGYTSTATNAFSVSVYVTPPGGKKTKLKLTVARGCQVAVRVL